MAHRASQVALIHDIHLQLQWADAKVRTDIAVPHRVSSEIISLVRLMKMENRFGGLLRSRFPEQERPKRGVNFFQERCDDLSVLSAAAHLFL
jgi:hypothetical protein